MTDLAKARREDSRWILLNALHKARPAGAPESLLLTVIRSIYQDATKNEVRAELQYLSDRDLIKLNKKPDGQWHSTLDRYGVDLVEYTVDCEPGIARPEKYWE